MILKKPAYLFVIGLGRSGTTALRTSLGLHPCLYYTGTENHIVGDVLRVGLQNCTSPHRKRAMVVSQQAYDRAFESLLNTILWPRRQEFPDHIRTAALAMPPDLADYLLQVFTNARIIHLVRNGIEVVASRQLHDGFKDLPFEDHCVRWARSYEFYQWGADKPQVYRLFRHEWLRDAQALRRQLEELFDWLNIPWHDAPYHNILSTRYHPTQHPGEAPQTPDEYAALSGTARADFDQIRRARWRFWSDAERETFQAHCGKAMRGFDYPIPWQAPAAPPEPTRPGKWLGLLKRTWARVIS